MAAIIRTTTTTIIPAIPPLPQLLLLRLYYSVHVSVS